MRGRVLGTRYLRTSVGSSLATSGERGVWFESVCSRIQDDDTDSSPSACALCSADETGVAVQDRISRFGSLVNGLSQTHNRTQRPIADFRFCNLISSWRFRLRHLTFSQALQQFNLHDSESAKPHAIRPLGNHRLRRRHRSQKRSRVAAGARQRTRRRHAAQRRSGRRLCPTAQCPDVVRRCRRADRRT